MVVCGLDKSEIVKSLTCCTEGTFRESEAKKVKNPKRGFERPFRKTDNHRFFILTISLDKNKPRLRESTRSFSNAPFQNELAQAVVRGRESFD